MVSEPKAHAVVAIYDSHAHAEDAVKALDKAGLDMKRLSIIGKNFHTHQARAVLATTGPSQLNAHPAA